MLTQYSSVQHEVEAAQMALNFAEGARHEAFQRLSENTLDQDLQTAFLRAEWTYLECQSTLQRRLGDLASQGQWGRVSNV